MKYIVEIYQTKEKKLPFHEWIMSLKDILGRQKINVRLQRLSLGNFGNCKSLKDGISELKIEFGPGYRVYYAQVGKNKILVLNAGSKKTQKKDIDQSKEYYNDYKMRGKK